MKATKENGDTLGVNRIGLVTVVGVATLVLAYCFGISVELLYLGLGGLAGQEFFRRAASKRSKRSRPAEASQALLGSRLTCPHCDYESEEIMPSEAHQLFLRCAHCSEVIQPRSGDCCVFCTHGSVKCPAMQLMEKRKAS